MPNLRTKHKSEPAKASDYLYWLKDYYHEHPDMIVILYLRVSARSQDHNGNLQNQYRVLRKKLRRRGIPFITCFREVGSGWVVDHTRGELRRAVRRARQYDNAVILAASSDRFLRNKFYNSQNNPEVLPTQAEFEKLRKLTKGVPLVSLLHPDKSWKKVRGYYSKWGQKVKGNKGGRPAEKRTGWTIDRREKFLPRVRRMLKKGKNITEISRKLSIARSTLDDWVKNYML
jgi:hypothetical protein